MLLLPSSLALVTRADASLLWPCARYLRGKKEEERMKKKEEKGLKRGRWWTTRTSRQAEAEEEAVVIERREKKHRRNHTTQVKPKQNQSAEKQGHCGRTSWTVYPSSSAACSWLSRLSLDHTAIMLDSPSALLFSSSVYFEITSWFVQYLPQLHSSCLRFIRRLTPVTTASQTSFSSRAANVIYHKCNINQLSSVSVGCGLACTLQLCVL